MSHFSNKRQLRIWGVSAASVSLFSLVVSCAREENFQKQEKSSISSLDGESLNAAVEKISFEQWCGRWGLNCSQPDSGKLGADGEFEQSNDVLKWKAIAELFEKAIASGSNFSLEQQELNSARVRIFLNQIGWGEVNADLLDVLSKSGLKKVGLEPAGKLRFEGRTTLNGQSGSVRGNSGMKWAFANDGEFSVGSAGQYLFRGLKFSAATSFESDDFAQLNFNDADQTTWSGNNLAVTHVPDAFFIKDIPVRWEKFSDLKQDILIRNATEARNIVFNATRNFRLNSVFFDTASKHTSLFVDDAKISGAVKTLVNSFGSLEMKAPTSSTPLAQLVLQQAGSVVCRIEMSGTPAIDITLDKRFGVQNVFTNDKTNAQVDLYGINVKARVGIPISFNLKRVDIEPTRIVVKGVPVVGDIVIPLPTKDKKFGKELKKFECVER